MLMVVREFIKKTNRKVYRFFRNPKRRKESAFHNWMAGKVFERGLWVPHEKEVARGIGLGLFIAVFPIPLQMVIVVALTCYLHATAGWRINIPAASAAVWVTNPVTITPIIIGESNIGRWLRSYVPVWDFPFVPEAVENMMLGAIVIAPVVAAVGYGLTIALWDLIAEHLLPVRGSRLARRSAKRSKATKSVEG